MVSLVRKLVPDPNLRKFYGAAVVLAANTGGAWTPIGDVTTTMLWINGNISTFATIQGLVLPSMACLAVPVVLMANFSEEMNQPPPALDQPKQAKDDAAATTGSSAGEHEFVGNAVAVADYLVQGKSGGNHDDDRLVQGQYK